MSISIRVIVLSSPFIYLSIFLFIYLSTYLSIYIYLLIIIHQSYPHRAQLIGVSVYGVGVCCDVKLGDHVDQIGLVDTAADNVIINHKKCYNSSSGGKYSCYHRSLYLFI